MLSKLLKPQSALQMQQLLAAQTVLAPVQSQGIHMTAKSQSTVASRAKGMPVANAQRFFGSFSSSSDSDGYSSQEERRPYKSHQRRDSGARFKFSQSSNPSVVLKNMEKFIEDKGTQLTDSEFAQYLQQVTRSSFVSRVSAMENRQQYGAVTREALKRLQQSEPPVYLNAYSDYIKFLVNRKFFKEALNSSSIITQVANKAFMQEELSPQIARLDFGEVASIFLACNINQNHNAVARRLVELIYDETVPKPLPKMVLVLEKISSDMLYTGYSGNLVDRILDNISWNHKLEEISPSMQVRILKATIATNLMKYAPNQKMVNELVTQVSQNIEELEEQSVQTLLDAAVDFQFFKHTQAGQAFGKMLARTHTMVVDMAEAAPEMVDIHFLAQYLHKQTKLGNAPTFAMQEKDRVALTKLLEEKVEVEKGQDYVSKTRAFDKLLEVCRVYVKDLPKLTQLAIDRMTSGKVFIEPDNFIQIENIVNQKNFPGTAEEKSAIKEKILEGLSGFVVKNPALNIRLQLAVMQYPASDLREELLNRFNEELECENMRFEPIVEFIKLYMSLPLTKDTQDRRQDLVKRVIDSNIFNSEEDKIRKLSYSQMIALDLAQAKSGHNFNECYVSKTLMPVVHQRLHGGNIEDKAYLNYFRVAHATFRSEVQGVHQDFFFANHVLRHTNEKFPADTVSGTMVRLMLSLIKDVIHKTNFQPKAHPMASEKVTRAHDALKNRMLNQLDRMELQKMNHESTKLNFQVVSAMNDSQIFERSLGRNPKVYVQLIKDIAESEATALSENELKRNLYIKAISLLNVDPERMSLKAKEVFGKFIEEFDSTSFVVNLQKEQQLDTQLQHLKFLDLVYKSKGDKVNEQELKDAALIVLSSLGKLALRSPYVFKNLLEFNEYDEKTVLSLNEEIDEITENCLTKTHVQQIAKFFDDYTRSKDPSSKFLTKKLTRDLLLKVHNHYQEKIESGNVSPHVLNDLFRIYARVNHNDMQDAYNSFIRGFGQTFDSFEDRHLAAFCRSLSLASLAQEDIFVSVFNRLKELVEQKAKQSPFVMTFLQLFQSANELGLKEVSTRALLDDCIKKAYGLSTIEMVEAGKFSAGIRFSILLNILSTGLDENEEFRQLAKSLVESLDNCDPKDFKTSLLTNRSIHDVLRVQSIIAGSDGAVTNGAKFVKLAEIIQEADTSKRATTNKLTNMAKNMKIKEHLQNLGYTTIQSGTTLGFEKIDFYLPEKNAVVIIAGRGAYNFDKATEKSRFRMIKRSIENLPEKPTLHVVNSFKFTGMKDAKDRYDYLKETLGIEQLSSEIAKDVEIDAKAVEEIDQVDDEDAIVDEIIDDEAALETDGPEVVDEEVLEDPAQVLDANEEKKE